MSLGMLARGKWLYFNIPLTRYHIALRQSRRLLQRFEVLGAVIFSFGFLGFSALKIYTAGYLELIFTPDFWLSGAGFSNFGLILFWFFLISLTYLIYLILQFSLTT